MADADNLDELGYAELQAALEDVAAQRVEFQLALRRCELVEAVRLKDGFAERARSVRDFLLVAPARQAAVLAAEHGLSPSVVMVELVKILRAALASIAKGPHSPGQG